MVESLAVVHDLGYLAVEKMLLKIVVIKRIQAGVSSFSDPGAMPSGPQALSGLRRAICDVTSAGVMGSSKTGMDTWVVKSSGTRRGALGGFRSW